MSDKVLSPEEAMKQFMSKGDTKEVVASSNFNPGFRLQNDEGNKTFMQGVLLRRRESVGKGGKPVAWYTFKLSQLSAALTKGVVKNGKTEYVVIPFVEGVEADTMSSTDLDRKLKDVAPGTDLLIVYKGKKTVETKKGKVRMHDFTVIQGQTEAAPTEAEEEVV